MSRGPAELRLDGLLREGVDLLQRLLLRVLQPQRCALLQLLCGAVQHLSLGLRVKPAVLCVIGGSMSVRSDVRQLDGSVLVRDGDYELQQQHWYLYDLGIAMV